MVFIAVNAAIPGSCNALIIFVSAWATVILGACLGAYLTKLLRNIPRVAAVGTVL